MWSKKNASTLTDNSSTLWSAEPDLKTRRLYLLALVLLLGMTLSVAFHYILGRVLHVGHVHTTFLVQTGGRRTELGNTFGDLFAPLKSAKASVKGGVIWLAPTPFFHVIYLALGPLGRIGALLLQYGVFFAGMIVLLWRTYVDALTSLAQRITYLFILLVFSYPVVFVLERGNLEMLVFVVMAGFLYAYYAKNSAWCVVLLAIAISLKIFPAVFLVLLIADRRYRWTLYTVLYSGLLTFGSVVLLALRHGFGLLGQAHMSINALREINRLCVTEFRGLPYGHSLWGLLVSFAGFLGLDQRAFVAHAASVYTIVVGVAFAALAVFVIRIVKLPWQRVALLTLAGLVLPTVSADYRLLYIYLPLAMLLNAPVRTRVDMACVALFGCLLVPMDYFYRGLLRVSGWAWPGDHTSTSVVVYPLVMIVLLAAIIWNAYGERDRPIPPL